MALAITIGLRDIFHGSNLYIGSRICGKKSQGIVDLGEFQKKIRVRDLYFHS